ncbi:MAG: 3'(2'),5'-bisphosphate nucleotidase CysQ family protein [Acidobacteriota bacterium]
MRAELDAALELARAAGELVMKLRGGELAVEMKPGDEPVTVADKRASQLIVDGLHARFPADPVISEEAPGQTLVPARMWLVDPIDGTKDFIRGSDGFSIMIGLAIAGRPAVGVVHQPAASRTFWASPEGAFVDGKPLAVSSIASAGEARLVASASHRTPDIDRVKQTLGIADEQNVGSVGVKLALIAMGVRDLYVNPTAKTKAWDTCAPEAILVRAGGRLTDLFGRPVDYASELRQVRGLVASNGHVHDEVVGKLAPLFEFMRDRRP